MYSTVQLLRPLDVKTDQLLRPRFPCWFQTANSKLIKPRYKDRFAIETTFVGMGVVLLAELLLIVCVSSPGI